jgi:hypothetical protein
MSKPAVTIRSLKMFGSIARIAIFIFITTAIPAANAQSDQPIKTSLCEIRMHPMDFNHKLVEVHAIASHGFEDSGLVDRSCPNSPYFWFEYGGKVVTGTMYCCGLTDSRQRPENLKVDDITIPLTDDALFKSFDQRLHPKHPKKNKSDTVGATLQGILFLAPQKLGQNYTQYGYGHMGCCILFAVTRVVAVDPDKSSATEKSN